MKKIVKLTGATLLALTIGFSTQASPPVPAPAPPQAQGKPNPEMKYSQMDEKFQQLTKEQQHDILDLQETMITTQMELMNKYVEYGMMSKEEADQINTMLQHHLQMIEANRKGEQ